MAVRIPSALLVLAHCAVVYAFWETTPLRAETKSSKSAKTAPSTADTAKPAKPSGSKPVSSPQLPHLVTNEALPQATQEMREALLAAAETGRIQELRTPIELNELKPSSGASTTVDPIEFWKSQSADSEGRDVLVALASVLGTTPLVATTGKDVENSRIFVWPGFADDDLASLSPAAMAELAALVTEPMAKSMIEHGRYSGWRVAIGADGVWHAFEKLSVAIETERKN
jgi:hypothetical protein